MLDLVLSSWGTPSVTGFQLDPYTIDLHGEFTCPTL